VRVLVTGAGGLLGGRLAALLAERGFDVCAVGRRSPPPPGLRSLAVELTDPGAVEELLEREKPDALVHAAVLGRTDQCEAQPEQAEAVNARLPGRVAAACRARQVRLVGLSTDLVLDGTQAFSDETARPAPLGVYGRTKLAGEEALLARDPSAAVARVALVVGGGHGPRGTASESVAWSLRAGRPLRLFADEFRTPVDPESVAAGIALLLERGGAGRFHLGGPERLSRLELGHRVARILALPAERIEAGFQASYPGPDPRPADTSLDSTRARRELGWTPRPLDDALRGSRPAPAGDGTSAAPA
jgi:dTDP-4-dehydrorhamnose reductase